MIIITNSEQSPKSNGNGNGKKKFEPEAVYEYLGDNYQWAKYEPEDFTEVVDDIEEDMGLIDYYDESTGDEHN